MFKQATPIQQHHAVTDDSDTVVKVYSARRHADQLIREFEQTRKLVNQGADPRLAFPPSTNVAFLVGLTKRTDHLKCVQLKERLSDGATVKQADISAQNWTRKPSWSLR
jgi:hypothetical protein